MEGFNKENERKKKILVRYRNNIFKIRKLEVRLQRVKDSLGVKGIAYASFPKSSGFTHDDLVIEKIDLEDRIARLKETNRKNKKIIEEAIDKMENRQLADVLELYFLKGYDVIGISIELGRHSRTVERSLSKAIEEIDI